MKRDDVVNEALEWLNTRFHHQAAVKGVGCDCIGLIAGVALNLGSEEAAAFFASPEYRNYGRAPLVPLLLEGADKFLDRADIDDVRIGDVLLMRVRGDPQHFAIVTNAEPARILHAWAPARRVVEVTLDDRLRDSVYRVYRYRGIE